MWTKSGPIFEISYQGKPLEQWERELKRQPTDSSYRCSELWHESELALKSGLLHTWWELGPYEKAWLTAVLETQELLTQVFEYAKETAGEA